MAQIKYPGFAVVIDVGQDAGYWILDFKRKLASFIKLLRVAGYEFILTRNSKHVIRNSGKITPVK